jgi:protein-tyrosine phosphatase
MIHLDGVYNFRDIGGHPARNGRRMKLGILFRSDDLAKLTKKDIESLRGLNLKTICDLRGKNERTSSPDHVPAALGIRSVNIPIFSPHQDPGRVQRLLFFLRGKFKGMDFEKVVQDLYHAMAIEHVAQIREVICLVSDERNLPALIHCTGGKDRTGFVAALIQLLVGVPRPVVLDDYLLSNKFIATQMARFARYIRVLSLFRLSTERMRPVLEARREYLEGILDELINTHGSIENYCRNACAISPEMLAGLRGLLLE